MKIVYVTIFLMNHALFSMTIPEKLICVYGGCLPGEMISQIYAAESNNKNSSACHARIAERLKEEIIRARLTRRRQLSPQELTELPDYEHKYTTEIDFFIELWKNQINYKKEKEEFLQEDLLEQQKQQHRAALEEIRNSHERILRMVFEHTNRIRALLEAEIDRCSKELAESREKLLQLHDETRRKRILHEQNYQCPVCKEPIKKAKISSNCRNNFHLFCARCTEILILRDSSCPVCREPNFDVFRQEIETPLTFLDEVA